MSKKDPNDNRPSSKELARKARAFVRENRNWMIEYIKPMLPYIVALALISGVGSLYNESFKFLAIILGYLYACFALSWHRAVLLGLKHEHRVNPFKIGKNEMPFLLAFLLVALVPAFFAILITCLLGVSSATEDNTAMIGVVLIVLYVLWLIGIIKAMRWSFMLPARSVGVKLSIKEATQISKGLVGRLFWADVRVLAVPFLVFFVTGFMIVSNAGFLTIEITTTGEVTRGAVTVLGIIFHVVMSLLGVGFQIFAAAINVTILSYLYQWAVQNRPVGAAQV